MDSRCVQDVYIQFVNSELDDIRVYIETRD